MSTDKLQAQLRALLDTYGKYGSDIDAAPGLVRRAGFLQHDDNCRYLTASVVVITEWVDVNLPDAPLVYQIDQRSHLIAEDSTDVIDQHTDADRAAEILEHVLPGLDQDQAHAYDNPDYAWVLKSLFDKEAYERDVFRSRQVSRRQLRQERKQIAKKHINHGLSPSIARWLARRDVERRYSPQ